ncbi:hypothetical protein GW17_00016806 [Ensete ventricosum]|nr:hypothetical protein GW17_00016806 [Ensete ventricosum]
MPLLPPLSSLLFATQPHPRCLPLLPLPGDTMLLIGSLPPLLSSTSAVAANPTSITPVANVSPPTVAGPASSSLISRRCHLLLLLAPISHLQ